jgi:hypothetical protein
MSFGKNFVTGAKFVNKGFSLLSHNKQLLLYPLTGVLPLIGVGILYLHPIIKTIIAAGSPKNVKILLASTDLFSPSFFILSATAIAIFFATALFTALIAHIANIIHSRPTTMISGMRSILSTNWRDIILWLILMVGLSYFSNFFMPKASPIGVALKLSTIILNLFLVFTFHYVIIKKTPFFSAITESIKLAWKKRACLMGTYVWLMLLTLTLVIVPLTLASFLGAIAIIIAVSLIILSFFCALTGAIAGTTMIFLSEHNELPAAYDVTKPTA